MKIISGCKFSIHFVYLQQISLRDVFFFFFFLIPVFLSPSWWPVMVFVCLVDEGMSYNYGVQMFVCSSVLVSVTVPESKTILVPVFFSTLRSLLLLPYK